MTGMKRGPVVGTVAGRSTGAATAIIVAAMTSVTAGCSRPTFESEHSSPTETTAALAPPAAAAPLASTPRAGFVRLARSAHPLARPELEVGRVEPGRRLSNLSLFFKLTPEQRRERDALAAAQLDRSSPLYHQWLTPETYRPRFGAKPADVARAMSWLAAQGLEVHRSSRLGTRVTFSGTAAQLEAAFQTELHYYRVAGEKHYAMAIAPAIPEDLADSVLSVYNTHDFVHRPASRKVNAGAAARRAEVSGHYQLAFDAGPDASGTVDLLGPPDWATAYDVAKLYDPGIGGKALDGSGVTIGIVGTAPIAQSDIDAFRANFGLPASTVKMTLVPNTGAPSTAGFGGGVEAILDVEWSGGVAKGATINYVFTGADDFNVDDGTFYLIEENLAPVMSESYGGCEAGDLPSDADVTEMNGTAANLMGITYMAAAGDSGAEDCGGDFGADFGGSMGAGLYVDLPGAFPGVTSVGGTQFPSLLWSAQGSLVDAGLEQVWNESNDPYSNYGVGAGGGGISSVFTRPA
jgi:subtilase family serine protease